MKILFFVLTSIAFALLFSAFTPCPFNVLGGMIAGGVLTTWTPDDLFKKDR